MTRTSFLMSLVYFIRTIEVITSFIIHPSSHTQGKAIGVGIGCILGMFPLLFFKDDDKKEGQTEAKDQTVTPPAPTESSKN